MRPGQRVSGKITRAYTNIHNRYQNLHKPRRLHAHDQSCCQLAGLIHVSSVHHKYVEVSGLHRHAVGLPQKRLI